MRNKAKFSLILPLLLLLLHLPHVLSTSQATLPFGDINVIVVTDVHSWVASHAYHEPHLDADYGHILSFYHRLTDICREERRDLFFVMNGDFVHGTGFSTNPPKYLVPILEHMPWDAVNIGNHEISEDETVAFITKASGFVERWGEAYLTSNVLLTDTSKPVGNRYRFLHGKFTNSTILTFGFLYDMTGASDLITVETVEEVVHADWFTNVLRGKEKHFDAIIVLAHMDVQDPLVNVILSSIRDICGYNMPVQFITGHTHNRAYHIMDNYSSSFEAGRYLDTVGFVSFPKNINHAVENSTDLFKHVFMDAYVEDLRNTLGVPNLDTTAGVSLSNLIRETQEYMGLLEVIGCSPQTFYLEKGIDEPDSLWGLYLNKVIPNQLFHGNSSSKIFVQNIPWYFRYDLFGGNVTVTDVVSVSTRNDAFYLVKERIPGSHVWRLQQSLNPEASTISAFDGPLPSYGFSGNIDFVRTYDLYTVETSLEHVTSMLANLTGEIIMPTPFEGGKQMSRSLWYEFIDENWSCEAGEGAGWHRTVLAFLAVAVVLVVLIFAGCRSHLYRRHGHQGKRSTSLWSRDRDYETVGGETIWSSELDDETLEGATMT